MEDILPPRHSVDLWILNFRAELLEAWLALTSVNYHDNLLILMLLNQLLALTMLRTTGPRKLLPMTTQKGLIKVQNTIRDS